MALSNLRNEPRREIIEQIVGVALFALYIATVYGIVWWLGAKSTADWFFGIFFTAVLLPAAVAVLVILTFALHGLGEIVCGWLGALGLDPRPTQRYRR